MILLPGLPAAGEDVMLTLTPGDPVTALEHTGSLLARREVAAEQEGVVLHKAVVLTVVGMTEEEPCQPTWLLVCTRFLVKVLAFAPAALLPLEFCDATEDDNLTLLLNAGCVLSVVTSSPALLSTVRSPLAGLTTEEAGADTPLSKDTWH